MLRKGNVGAMKLLFRKGTLNETCVIKGFSA